MELNTLETKNFKDYLLKDTKREKFITLSNHKRV